MRLLIAEIESSNCLPEVPENLESLKMENSAGKAALRLHLESREMQMERAVREETQKKMEKEV